MSIPFYELKEHAKALFKDLAWFAIVRSPDLKKHKALERLQEIRLEVQEILDKVAPGWDE